MSHYPVLMYDRGELLWSYRSYLGLTQRGLAFITSMPRYQLQRMERNAEPCTMELFEKLGTLVTLFNEEVELLKEKAEVSQTPFTLVTGSQPSQEWERSIVGRAALYYPDIILIRHTGKDG